MKALHLLKTSTGATWAVRQMRELVKLGIEVHAAMPPGGPRVAESEAAGVTVHRVKTDFPVRRPWGLRAACSGMRRLVDTVKPDLIHSHFVGTTLVMRISLGRHHRTPRAFQVPGPLHLERGPYGPVETALAGRRDHWIASCEWTRRKYLSAGIPGDKVHISFYGSDTSRFETSAKGRLRRELTVGEKVPLVGMVAYMYPPKRYLGHSRGLKGHEDFIEAMALVRKKFPDARAVLVGSQWGGGSRYETLLRRQAASLLGDAAVFLGHRDDIPSIYADLDVAVHPSLSENLGGAGESLMAGVPTITTDVGGFPDIVKDGKTGWLVPPRCPERLADAIVHALSDPVESRRLAANGRSLVSDTLDVRKTAQEIAAIYEKVLCRQRWQC